MEARKIRHLLTRIGIGIVLVVFGAWEITNPAAWVGFLPPLFWSNTTMIIVVHGVAMIAVGLAILTGFYLRIAAILSSIMLLAIIISLMVLTGYMDLVIRDTGLLLLSLSIIFDDVRYLTLTK
ncbi:MAG: DoxX family membrane protein [Candidatus Micrarchaeota archaeon]|nr:DoxX family membrane protein [Candidatus Micrarchaeota archaeon]MDE1847367.1 DoxX family membrane protein [Candidatus Micrarchaeota archaeon]MDE1863982.1 DoxX family membrane protein [Candidatus Micrarchaeota archaeon]